MNTSKGTTESNEQKTTTNDKTNLHRITKVERGWYTKPI